MTRKFELSEGVLKAMEREAAIERTVRIAWLVANVVEKMADRTGATDAEIAAAFDMVLKRRLHGAVDEAWDRLGEEAIIRVSEKIEKVCDDFLVGAERV